MSKTTSCMQRLCELYPYQGVRPLPPALCIVAYPKVPGGIAQGGGRLSFLVGLTKPMVDVNLMVEASYRKPSI